MGKSPGKWIKGLFSKKTSKSSLSKGRELARSASEKPARVTTKEPISISIQEEPIISSPLPVSDICIKVNSSVENGASEKLAITSPKKQDEDIVTVSDVALPNETEKLKLEQAATVLQASYRSYQARCEFQRLKGIIRLQSIVRGSLVRRQAIATLFCVQGIVKFQAITRGHLVRQSNTGNELLKRQSLVAKDAEQDLYETNKYSRVDTLLKNAFVDKLLSSSPTPMPLYLQYSPGEPNSAWDWLHRWSISQVWGPNSKQKESCDVKHLTVEQEEICVLKHQTVETEETKPKINIRIRSSSLENGTKRASSEKEKLKHNGKKLSVEKSLENLSVEKDIKDDFISNENYKSNRRASLPAKHDVEEEATPENGKRVPSYMAKTASSKAKVRGQVSPRLGLDNSADKHALTRRFSLPSTNGKMSSSPRVHRLVQANAREGIKIDRSLSSSRDITDKAIPADWKR